MMSLMMNIRRMKLIATIPMVTTWLAASPLMLSAAMVSQISVSKPAKIFFQSSLFC